MNCACGHKCCAEVERLRNRISELEYSLGLSRNFPDHHLRPLKLTARSRKLLRVILKRKFVHYEAAFSALYDGASDDLPDIKIISVLLCKVRKAVRPYGVEIDTVWGQGIAMSDANKLKLRTALGIPEQAEAA